MIKPYTYVVVVLVVVAVTFPIIIFRTEESQGNVLTFEQRPINDTSYLSRYYQIKYRTIDKIYTYMEDLIGSYSFFCELDSIGYTTKKGKYLGLPINLLSVSSGFPKPIILIIGGINANDWQSTTSILYIANQLLGNCSETGQLIATYDWHFIPVLNPDGYNYSFASPSTKNWIKNIARWSMDYIGVNLDYNFGKRWKENRNYNEDTYPGVNAFSEAESKTLRQYIFEVKDYIELVIIFKSPLNRTGYKPAITYPWSYTSKKPPNWVLLQYLAAVGAEAALKTTGTEYDVEQSGRLMVNQTGRIDDWILDIGIKKVITVQRNFVANITILPYEIITAVGAEMFAIVKTMSITAFYQPLSYRKTHDQIDINRKLNLKPFIEKFDMAKIIKQKYN